MVKTNPSKKTDQIKRKRASLAEDHLVDNSKIGKKMLRRAMPAVMRVLISVLFLVVFAGLFTWYILLQQNTGDVDATMQFIHEKPILAGYSYTIILLLMCVIAAVTWRPFLTIGISFALSSIIMYINAQKFTYRNAPLLPEDFLMAEQAGTLAQFIDAWSVTRLALGVVLVLVGSGIIEYGMRRIFGYDIFGREAKKYKAWWERHSILPRLAWTAIAATGLLMFARPVLHYDDQNEDADTEWIEGLEFSYWNQKSDYLNNGFIVAFLHDLGGLREREPDDYSEAAVAAVAEKYTGTDEQDGKKKNTSLDQVADNIIVVLNESFMDPEILGEVYSHTGGDVVPNLHKIFEKYPSGYMYSPGYGGGTANIEFEVLTSLSNYWAQTSPYVTSLSKMKSIPGLIGNAVDDGFQGAAIHAFDGSMYKRNAVYGRMGVETFLDYSLMKYTDRENGEGYVSDQAVYKEALDVLKGDDGKHMLMIATMQNHMPYDAANYDKLNYKLRGSVAGSVSYFESYLETVHHADEYLGEFVAELNKLEGKTVMLWFGDHAPALLWDYVDSDDPELVDLAHLTPYFIYANFDLDELYSEDEVAKMNAELGIEIDADGVDLPVVTPNCFMSMLYEMLGVKMPVLVKLTSEVCAETPVLAPTYSKNSTIEESESEALKDYRLVNYDMLSGKRYWLDL